MGKKCFRKTNPNLKAKGRTERQVRKSKTSRLF
jgi:hypothetical protein